MLSCTRTGDAVDLTEAETFVRVVETGSMTGAAERIGVPRSTVSRRVARLEESLGVRLLQRTTRQMKPTEEGQALYQRLAPALASVREAAEVIRDAGEKPQGLLRVTAVVDFGHSVLAPLVAEFVHLYPAVQVEVDVDNRTVDLVQEGYDCAIRAGPQPDSTLVARSLGTFDFGLYASRAYLERRGRPAALEEVAAHDCVVMRPTGGEGRWRLRGPDGKDDVVIVPARIGTDDFGFVRHAVRAGGGIGLMPAFVADDPVAGGDLERVLPAWGFSAAAIRFVTPGGRYLPAKVRAFRDFLVERMKTLEERCQRAT